MVFFGLRIGGTNAIWSRPGPFPGLFDVASGRNQTGNKTVSTTGSRDHNAYEKSSPTYQWRALPKPTDIRLVHLFPAASFDDPLNVRITINPMNDLPNYTALSYCWGDPTPVHEITSWVLTGPEMYENEEPEADESSAQQPTDSVLAIPTRAMIPDNLQTALKHIRDKADMIFVWTDFLCINQEDLVEKAMQVARMHEIYQHAMTTTVYLGDASHDDYSDQIHAILPQIDKWLKAGLTGSFESDIQYMLELSTTVYNGLEESGLFPQATTNDERWRMLQQALRAFFSRSWFRRVWVIQEAVAAVKRVGGSKLRVRCGTQRLAWSQISSAFILCVNMPLTNVQKGIDPSAPNFNIVDAGQRSTSLFELLCYSQELESSDPRDHCFALLGLVDDKTAPLLRPNYESRCQDVFRRYTQYLIDQGYGPQLLPRAIKSTMGRKDREPCPDLPSWVPDWSFPAAPEIPQKAQPHVVYAAGGRSRGHFQVRDDKILVTRGFIFDKVQHAMPMLGWDTRAFDSFEEPVRSDLQDVDYACRVLMQYMAKKWNGAWFKGDIPTYMTRFLSADMTPGLGTRLVNIKPEAVNMVTAILQRNMEKLKSSLESAEVKLYLSIMTGLLRNSNFATTARNYIVRVPRTIAPTDVIAVVLGCDIPLVLGRVDDAEGLDLDPDLESPTLYRIKGWAFVPGIMDGEVFDNPTLSLEDIVLV